MCVLASASASLYSAAGPAGAVVGIVRYRELRRTILNYDDLYPINGIKLLQPFSNV